MSRQSLSRSDRVAQMTKQEELIAKKRQELVEKQKTVELGKAVAAAQSGGAKANKEKEQSASETTSAVTTPSVSVAASIVPPDMKAKFQNSFCNDGSFLTHFKKILEEKKKIDDATMEKKAEEESKAQEQPPVEESLPESQSLNQPLPPTQTNNQPEASILQQPPPPIAIAPPPPPPVAVMHPTSITAPPPPPPPYTSASVPMSNVPSYTAATAPPAFFNPCIPPMGAFSSINTPPPPPPPSTPLYLIPPPDPLQLNKIPPPKDLDLNAIPKPEMNVETIRVPTAYEQQQQLQQQQEEQQLGPQYPQPQVANEPPQKDANDQFLPTTLESLVELVAEKGDAYEDQIRSRKNDVHSSLWFLFDVESMAYKNYRSMVENYRQNRNQNRNQNQNQLPEQETTRPNESDSRLSGRSAASIDEKYDPESVIESHEDSDDEYMKDIMGKNLSNLKRKIDERRDESDDGSGDELRQERNRKRKSRWGGKASVSETAITALVQTNFANQNKPLLSSVQRTDPALLQYARQNYGTTNLTDDDWRKCEDHFKINLLYQDMMRKRKEIDQLAVTGKFKYEYDSDEDTHGGTWEHKLRTAEMEATRVWADALTAHSEGKHHIGDFLPPEELKKFMEKYDAKKNNRTPDLSDYKEYKLTEDNIGFQMLQKLGWKEGQGLGAGGTGIVDPVNKAPQRDSNQGLGAGMPSAPEDCDNEYEAYRKRMMLAYRFRPNPLNNPRRAYY